VVRICHWATAIVLRIMIASRLEIFRAFPSFGAMIPQQDPRQGPGTWLRLMHG